MMLIIYQIFAMRGIVLPTSLTTARVCSGRLLHCLLECQIIKKKYNKHKYKKKKMYVLIPDKDKNIKRIIPPRTSSYLYFDEYTNHFVFQVKI